MTDKKVPLTMNDEFREEDTIRYIKSYMFIKGIAIAENLEQTLTALAIARRMHNGQYRKDGLPYILHPLKVCSTLINYGIRDDIILASSLLHDVLEDCQDKLPLGGKEIISEYHINPEIFEIITILSKPSGLNEYELSLYFDKIKKNPKALLIKLSDRFHNSQTLYTFSPEKMKKYIKETNMFLLPMASYGKSYYPKYTNALSILKSNINSLNHSMEIITEIYDKKINDLDNIIKNKDKEIEELKRKL